jgi:hypothetical protein
MCLPPLERNPEINPAHHFLDAPEAPLNFGATEIFRSENDCEVLVKWDPPAIGVDIEYYTVYVPPPNMNINETSFISTLVLRDCPEHFDIEVAAVNHFGCVGISVRVPVQLTLQSTSPTSPESSTPESSALLCKCTCLLYKE